MVLLRRIRAGASIDSILREPIESSACITSLENQTRRNLILILVQSTAPLRSMVPLARTLLVDTPLIALPPRDIYEALSDQIITTDTLTTTFGRHCLADHHHVQNDADIKMTCPSTSRRCATGPLVASSWTQLLTNNLVFADLISLFLEVINPYWSLLDEDDFLYALRSGRKDDVHCSRLLIHAILSCVSVRIQSYRCDLSITDIRTRCFPKPMKYS